MAVHDFKSQRLFVEDNITLDVSFDASREQANYLLNVLRMKDEDAILVFNGSDGEWRSIIEVQGRKKCRLKPVEKIRDQPEPPTLIYYFAPLKQARLDYMIQKAVEMGAGVLQPVITQFTQARNVNDKRIASNTIEAVEQCGILSIPEIRDAIPINKLGDSLGNDIHLIFCDEAAFDTNPIEHLKESKPDRLGILIGPEGGFSDDERAMLNALPNVTRLGLGPRILRADTAAVAALAVVQATIGDWYS